MLPSVGMLEINEGVDRAKFKQPYDEFLAEALATNESAKLPEPVKPGETLWCGI